MLVRLLCLTSAALLAAPAPHAAAQSRTGHPDRDQAPRAVRPAGSAEAPGSDSIAGSPVVLGLTLNSSGSDRDTLGLLVSEVERDSPADRAGIGVGSRLAAIEGVSLRLAPEDIGQPEAAEVVQRRLAREMTAIRGRARVTLRVYNDGRFQLVSVRNADGASADAPRAASAQVDAKPGAPTLADVMRILSTARTQLQQLADLEDPGPMLDSLVRAERDLAVAQRRLRPTQTRREPLAITPGSIDSSGSGAAGDVQRYGGLRVAPVPETLRSYFGDGSEHGLLVLSADSSWSPLHTGDVILRVDGEPVAPGALRDASAGDQQIGIDVLRGHRLLSLTLHTED